MTQNNDLQQIGNIAIGEKPLDAGIRGITDSQLSLANLGGDIWLKNSLFSGGQVNNEFKHTVLHEILHALGINDAETAFGSGSAEPQNKPNYTATSNSSGGYGNFEPETLQLYDISALQHLYGAAASRNNGNTTYSYDGSNTIESVYDTGGRDKISASGASAGVIVNLNQTAFSSVGSFGQGFSITEPANNISISKETIIEDADGSGYDDVLIGNEVGNKIEGNGGNDLIFGDAVFAKKIFDDANEELRSLIFDTEKMFNVKDYQVASTTNALDNDTINGGAGLDWAFGGHGDDSIDGGAGNDYLDGGAEIDAAVFGDITGNVNIKKLDVDDIPDGVLANSSPVYQVSFARSGSTETDKIRDFEQISFGDNVQRILLEGDLSIGQSKLLIDGGGGTDGVDLSRGEVGITTQVQTFSGVEYVVVNGTGAALRNVEAFVGTKFVDNITTNEGNQILYGREGSDNLSAGIGADILEGGLGNDQLTGGAGDDKFIVGQGDDIILDSDNGDRLFIRLPVANGSDPETSADATKVVAINGGFFMRDYWDFDPQTLSVDGAYFYPVAFSTNDPNENTPLLASLGDDYALFFIQVGSDLHIQISYSGVEWTPGYAPHPDHDASITIKNYESGDFGLTFTNLVMPFNLELGFIEQLNTDYQTAHNSLLDGGAFDDISVAKNFLYVQEGTSNPDTLAGTDGDDRMHGGGGDDTIMAAGGDDEIEGGEGNDDIDAGDGDDLVKAGQGDDVVEGGDGNDTIDGDEGNDWIIAGDGEDTIIIANDDGGDTIADFDLSDDVISLWVSDVWDFTTLMGYATEFEGDTYFDFYPFGIAMRLIGVSPESLTADNFTFAHVGTIDEDYIEGTSNGDNIIGLAGADILIGGDGNDIISAGDGADEVSGGSGDDRIDGGAGDDAIDGSDGADTYVYGIGSGNDSIIDWGFEVDVVEFGAGITADNISIERAPNDFWGARIVLNTGESLTITGQFDDPNFMMEKFSFADGTEMTDEGLRLAYIAQHTTAGDDDLHGFYNADVLNASDGNDTINGDAGNDVITGDYGDDVLTGGSDEDTFVFALDFGLDTITDFEGGAGAGDVIRFDDDIFANFTAVMNAATQVGDDVVITVDEFVNVITLEGITKASLNQDDFLLS